VIFVLFYYFAIAATSSSKEPLSSFSAFFFDEYDRPSHFYALSLDIPFLKDGPTASSKS
jgi:hypothetical protein